MEFAPTSLSDTAHEYPGVCAPDAYCPLLPVAMLVVYSYAHENMLVLVDRSCACGYCCNIHVFTTHLPSLVPETC
jgi:hypothetical protein